MTALPNASTIGLGTSRLRSLRGGLNRSEAVRLIREAFDLGITFYDTANSYGRGQAERAIGEALLGKRDKVVLATKVGIPTSRGAALRRYIRPILKRVARVGSRRSIRRAGSARHYSLSDVEASLTRLRTDHVDVLYLHSPGPPDSPAIDLLETALARGLSRTVGVSVTGSSLARDWDATGMISVIQLGAGLEGIGDLQQLRSVSQATLVGREVFSGGRMFDEGWVAARQPVDYPDRPVEYLKWLTRSRLVDHILVGTTNSNHLRIAVDAVSNPVEG